MLDKQSSPTTKQGHEHARLEEEEAVLAPRLHAQYQTCRLQFRTR
jgi:hypothetical protein